MQIIRNMSHASTLVNKCEPRMFFRYLLIQSHHCKKVTLHFFLVGVWKIQNRPPPFPTLQKTRNKHTRSSVLFPSHPTTLVSTQVCFPRTQMLSGIALWPRGVSTHAAPSFACRAIVSFSVCARVCECVVLSSPRLHIVFGRALKPPGGKHRLI